MSVAQGFTPPTSMSSVSAGSDVAVLAVGAAVGAEVVEMQGEEGVGGLGPGVGEPAVVAGTEVDVIPPDVGQEMA